MSHLVFEIEFCFFFLGLDFFAGVLAGVMGGVVRGAWVLGEW